MRRLARHLFTLCSIVSLLLCVAFGALWGAGYNGSPSSVWREARPVASLCVSVGVELEALSFGVITPGPPRRPTTFWHRFGFARMDSVAYAGAVYLGRRRGVLIPLWFATPLAGVMPGLWAMRRMIRRSHPGTPGLCPACGYDLRASPGQCPECGASGARGGSPVGSSAHLTRSNEA